MAKIIKEHLLDAVNQLRRYIEESGGGSNESVDTTQAEYEALPDTKLTDNKNYFIKDIEQLIRNGTNYTGPGGGGGAGMTVKTGTFISSTTAQGRVFIDCGFKPDAITVQFLISGTNKTFAYYNVLISPLHSYWELKPTENVYYVNMLTKDGTGETGICNVTDNGFEFRSNGGNARGVECTYQAYKFGDIGSGGGSGPSGGNVKTKTYTGTGTTSNTIEFDETPTFILGIGVVSENASYYLTATPFPFNTGNFKVFSSDGTEYVNTVTVSGNTLTIKGVSKYTALNAENTSYKIAYATSSGTSGGGSSEMKTVSGTFTSPATSQGTVHVDCGFKPDIISAFMTINGKNTCSYFNKFIRNDGAYWDLRPFENTTYFNSFDVTTGETGICGVDETGFTFRAKASSTLNIECSYTAYKLPNSGDGGSSGGGYSETLLFDNTDKVTGGTITLSDSINNYDEIRFETTNNTGTNWNVTSFEYFPTSVLKERIGQRSANAGIFVNGVAGAWAAVYIDSDTALGIGERSSLCIKSIYGIKHS